MGNGADDFVGGSSYLQISENQLNASTIGVPSKYAYERMRSPSNPNFTYPAAGGLLILTKVIVLILGGTILFLKAWLLIMILVEIHLRL